ncbi:MAG: 3-dehydroquinate synthase family protein [Acidimicrobiia bacterium]|nr:3-dehydroquinate synthase family protein [Acidimicrobiia bacterium]
MDDLRTVNIDLGDRSYPVVIGDAVRHTLADHIPAKAQRVAIVTQESIGVRVDSGREQREFFIAQGESAKVLSTIESLCRQWAQWGLNRNDVVVGVGGGIVTDVAGFAASVYHRGIPVVQVATSLLGQIDAAIGGKTGVNLPEGKNLVGTYWQPHAVLCDLEVLRTLPARHYRAGLGELAKYHFLDDGSLNALEIGSLEDGRLSIDAIADRVEASVRLKAAAVMADEREGGQRALLNYGHTLGHALETLGDHDLLHGEAVAIGIIFAAELARTLGRIDDARVSEHRRIISAYDLPMRPPGTPNFDDIVPLLGRDKKALDGLTFILDGDDGCEIVKGIETDALAESYARFLR